MNRNELFKQIDQGIDGRSFRLDKFRLNDVVSSVVCPRFFVQQLVIDCIQVSHSYVTLTLPFQSLIPLSLDRLGFRVAWPNCS